MKKNVQKQPSKSLSTLTPQEVELVSGAVGSKRNVRVEAQNTAFGKTLGF